MHIHFEELSAPQRAGGIEAATCELVTHLRVAGVTVSRSSESAPSGQPDCVHFQGIWSPRLARQFRSWHQQGVPCAVSPHGMLEPWALSHKRLKKWIAWHVYQKRLLNQAVVLHGTSVRETANFKKLGLKPPTAMIPWGVSVPPAESISAFQCFSVSALENAALPSSPPEVPAPFQLSEFQLSALENAPRSPLRKVRTLLFLGRIYPVKGLPLLIEAWAQVRPADWKLRIVGPDEAGHRAEVEAAVRRHGLTTVVEFAGELTGPAKAAAYDDADLFILPSHTENFGMAVAEALGHGVPVITTKGAPWSELVTQRCGWWVDIGAAPLAAALREAVQLSDDQRREMGLRGRQWMARDFSWSSVAEKMKSVYAWLLGGGGVGGGQECVWVSR